MFQSLYPYVLKNCRFPIGHPIVISDAKDIDPALPYFGLLKGKILPPRSNFLPLLHLRTGGKNGRLMFPLCANCATNLNQGPCNCTDDQRALVDVWTVEEVRQSLKRGYRLMEMYELYHFPESTKYDRKNPENGGLFQVKLQHLI